MTDPVLIVGTGALAVLFAARLSASGVDVTMLGSWPAGLAALEKDGARLDDFAPQPVKVARHPSECQGIKTVLVLVKSWQTRHVALQLDECLPQDGLVISLQNGLGNDQVLSGILGEGRVGRGITTLGATLLGPGHVHLGGEGIVSLEHHPRLINLVQTFERANFSYHIVEDILPLIWGKLVINSAINPLTAVLRMKNGALLENDSARELLKDLARESASVAEACSIELPYSDPCSTVEETARKSADNISSMLQDIQRCSQTEVDMINGKIVQIGQEAGLAVPYNRSLWMLVKALSEPVKI